MARDTAEIAFSWLTTRLWRSDSMRSSLSPSSWLIDVIGTPVHFDTTSSMSARPTITLRALDFTSKRSRTNARFSRAESSSSRRLLRRLEVLLRDRLLHLLDRDADALVDLAELLAVAGFLQLGARAGLVEQVDRLVGQEPVGDVAARLVDRRLDGLARVLDVVELLVAVLHAEQDLDRFLLGRRIDLDRLEAALERAVLLDVLAVLGRRRRADAADLAARAAPA